jgi:C-terminal peptidase prc
MSLFVISRTRATAGLFFALSLLVLAVAAGCNNSDQGPRVVTMGSPVVQQATPADQSSNITPVPGDATVSPTPTLMPESARRATFDYVWDTVRFNYLDPDYHGVDWDQVGDEYRAKAMEATNAPDFFDAIAQMVTQLKDDHSHYLSPWEARDEDDFINGRVNYVGIGILAEPGNGSESIVYVFPRSPADQAGIKRRDRLLKADGQPITQNEKGESNIRGTMFTTVTLKVESPGESPRDVVVERRLVGGRVQATSRLMEEDPTIGYIIVPSLFVGDMGLQVQENLAELHRKALFRDQPLKGVIIDLRGNGGGWYELVQIIAGQFTTGEVGGFHSNNSAIQSELETYGYDHMQTVKGQLYDQLQNVKVVVLVDKETSSAAEALAAILQAKGRAKVVGVPSKGNTEAVNYYDLKDGSRLWLADSAFTLPNGTSLEDKGVTPDAVVDVDWLSYPERDDPQIKKALELLH